MIVGLYGSTRCLDCWIAGIQFPPRRPDRCVRETARMVSCAPLVCASAHLLPLPHVDQGCWHLLHLWSADTLYFEDFSRPLTATPLPTQERPLQEVAGFNVAIRAVASCTRRPTRCAQLPMSVRRGHFEHVVKPHLGLAIAHCYAFG